MKRRIVTTMTLVLLLALPALAAYGGRSNGLFLGVMVPYNAFGGDFNGDNYFDSGSELIYVPKLAKGTGWGLIAGSYSNSYDGEFYYMHSKHDYTFLDVGGEATLDAIGMNMRWYFVKTGVLRPYFNMALDFAFLKVVDGAATYPFIRFEDTKFSGLGLCGGLGLGLLPVKSVLLFAGAEVRWNPFGRVKVYGGDKYTLKKLSSLAICLRGGIAYRFK